MIPGVKEIKEREIMALVSARAELTQLDVTDDDEEGGDDNEGDVDSRNYTVGLAVCNCAARYLSGCAWMESTFLILKTLNKNVKS